MRTKLPFDLPVVCAAVAALVIFVPGVTSAAEKPAAKPSPASASKTATAKTKSAAQTNNAQVTIVAAPGKPAEIPQSVFVVASNPKAGRNPFFPKSNAMQPQPQPVVDKSKGPVKKSIDLSSIVLNGLTGPPKRLAMINGRTFEAGESGEVKLPGGAKLHIQCEEIKDDSVTIVAGGERKELRLRELVSNTPPAGSSVAKNQ